MNSDEEDFVFYGTPIEREEEMTSRKKKSVAEASGQLRALPPWKQEVRDEEGRRRLHGAFTGGFSAGYFNTVGSKEGWTPQTFTSSRKSRAEFKQQDILNFLDDDERADMENQSIGTSSQFDTFGFTAAETARRQADNEQKKRPSAIPGPIPDELVVPATKSVGVRLLLKMGWRHGRSIMDSRPNSSYDARREARKALLALSSHGANAEADVSEPEKSDIGNIVDNNATDDSAQFSQSTPVYVLNPKQDLHGLGYDPFKHAPEFRENKRSRISDNIELGHNKGFSIKDDIFASKSGKVAPGFGIGALEELDDEDEDVYASGFELENNFAQEVEEPLKESIGNKLLLTGKERGVLPGFKSASKSEYQLERFDPPVIPKDFVPHHTFPGPLENDNRNTDPPPPEACPPEDNNLKVLIEGVATLVARCGKLFEDLSKEKNQSNPLFGFLRGDKGHDYYVRKLWEERQKRIGQTNLQLDEKSSPSVQRMTAESRGRILGERPLERSSNESNESKASVGPADVQLQFHLSDTFTKPLSFNELVEIAKPFKDNPAKQERFERFLKEKYQGGLRSTGSTGASNMSEASRARERLDFEAAADAIEKAKLSKDIPLSDQPSMQISAMGALQFTSGGLEQAKVTQAEEQMVKKVEPKREEFQWRPSAILCKRFDLIDPYMGKPPPPPRMKGKIDTLIFTADSVKASKVEETFHANRDTLDVSHSDTLDRSKEDTEENNKVDVEVQNVERPVDLYKAIFSDDSDNEEEEPILNHVKENSPKKTEAASTTLNRLIAGDFLESLGKELGLEVPPDKLYSMNKTGPDPLKQRSNEKTNKQDIQDELMQDSLPKSGSLQVGRDFSEKESEDVKLDKVSRKESSSRKQNWSDSSSSDYERSRKRSRGHRRRSRDLGSDSDSDHRDRYHSRSKGSKSKSSKEKSSSSRKHSKHHRDRSRDSPSRSHRSSEKQYSKSSREKRK